jgi:hypothetical protein
VTWTNSSRRAHQTASCAGLQLFTPGTHRIFSVALSRWLEEQQQRGNEMLLLSCQVLSFVTFHPCILPLPRQPFKYEQYSIVYSCIKVPARNLANSTRATAGQDL